VNDLSIRQGRLLNVYLRNAVRLEITNTLNLNGILILTGSSSVGALYGSIAFPTNASLSTATDAGVNSIIHVSGQIEMSGYTPKDVPVALLALPDSVYGVSSTNTHTHTHTNNCTHPSHASLICRLTIYCLVFVRWQKQC
jgi:hypothetical protein